MSFKNIKSHIKDYFTFTSRERNSLFILICISLLLIGGLFYFRFEKPSTPIDFSEFEKEIDAFEKRLTGDSIRYAEERKQKFSRKDSAQSNLTVSETSLFNFNPNNLPDSLWIKLGLNERTVRTIKNYESKGGKFYKKEDVKKIYGLHEDMYARLEPFIILPETKSISKQKTETKKDSANNNQREQFTKIPQPIIVFDLNKATVEELKTLKGVGDFKANSIIKYKNMLGGYVKKEQLLEAYGMTDSLYNEIKNHFEIKTKMIRPVNINSNDETEMKHPYISKQLARLFISYRKMHGDFKDVNELKKISFMEVELFAKLEPYLAVE
ncbi:MAG: helix-hairpin-helix domain-containing protein [Bacteroidia bacterium]